MTSPDVYKRILWFFLAWCACWVFLQAIAVELTFEFGWSISFADSAITNLFIAFAGYDMILVMRYYNPRQSVRLAMSVALAVITVLAISHMTVWLIEAPPSYEVFVEQSMVIRGLYCWMMIALITHIAWIWFTLAETREAEKRTMTAQELAREAELSKLRQQLQPHFLFNSLNSISALAGTRPEEARKMIHQLSDFFRSTLKKESQKLIPFSEELEHLTLYLEIEKVRFGHRLRTDVTCSNEALMYRIPPLLLQPIVENAIKFGLYDTLGETIIRINATAQNEHLVLTVTNPYDSTSAQSREGTGFGLSSIRRRLYLLYARNDLLQTSQTNNLFTTTLKIPQHP